MIKIVVRHMPCGTTEEEVRALFCSHGPVSAIRMASDTGADVVTAVVEMPISRVAADMVAHAICRTALRGKVLEAYVPLFTAGDH